MPGCRELRQSDGYEPMINQHVRNQRTVDRMVWNIATMFAVSAGTPPRSHATTKAHYTVSSSEYDQRWATTHQDIPSR